MVADLPLRLLDQTDLGENEYWAGNTAEFRCPHCVKVFLVSGLRVSGGERACPKCGKSTGDSGIKGKKSGATARFEW